MTLIISGSSEEMTAPAINAITALPSPMSRAASSDSRGSPSYWGRWNTGAAQKAVRKQSLGQVESELGLLGEVT